LFKHLTTAALLLAGTVPLAIAAQQPQSKPQPGAVAQPLNRDILHVQVILDKLGFGPGVIDGKGGESLKMALRGFQESRGLPRTGEPDAATLNALNAYRSVRPTVTLELNERVLAGPYVNPIPKDYAEQSKLPGMAYRSPIEKLAEMFHTTPAVLIALNQPGTRLAPGSKVVFPNALPSSRAYDEKLPETFRATLNSLNVDARQPAGAKIVVDKSDGVLRVLDKQGKLVAQFSATMGSSSDPLPLGNWKVLGHAYNPDWKMNPAILKKVDDSKSAQIIPPGPNNPVGVVWIDLSKPHYGIHGTSEPQQIGRAESNGCIRLTNWDAARLALMVKAGTPAVFQA
jgi:lipoprotein-anchoring transpeptidase ErfK/SrfK